jgi:predicted negative regulator of RcsB-dependent stress response
MVTVVVILNVLLAALGFFLAWKLWQLRQAFSRAADALMIAERSTHQVLSGAPEAILNGEIGTRQLKQNYLELQPKIRRAKQALALLSLSQKVLFGRRRGFSTRLKKSRTNRKSL